MWSLGQILIDMSCVAIYTESGGNAAAYQILTAAPGVKVMDGDEDEGGAHTPSLDQHGILTATPPYSHRPLTPRPPYGTPE